MASEFYNATRKDERKEWRQHPTTVLALKMLRDFQVQSVGEVLNYRGASGEILNYNIGFQKGIADAIELLEKE